MRISQLGRQEVRPREFWVTVWVVTLLLGGIGVSFMRTGKVPEFPTWLWAGLLLFMWGKAILDGYQHGTKAFSHERCLNILGGTLFAGSHLVLHLGLLASWAGNLGLVIIMWVLLAPWVEFGKHSSPTPPDTL